MRKLTVGLVGALTLLAVAGAQGEVIIDPDDFSTDLWTHEDGRTETVLPGVTLQAILGCTEQWPPDGEVLSLPDPVQTGDRAGNRVFGWHSPVLSNEPFKAKWSARQVFFAAIFDEPVSRVSLDFLGEDAYDEGYLMAFGQNAFPNWPATGAFCFADLLNNSQLLDSVFVTLNGPTDRKTAVISRPQEDIFLVLASGNFNCDTGASHDVILDKFTHGPIPEPSTLAIFLGGLCLALGFRRFRKRNG